MIQQRVRPAVLLSSFASSWIPSKTVHCLWVIPWGDECVLLVFVIKNQINAKWKFIMELAREMYWCLNWRSFLFIPNERFSIWFYYYFFFYLYTCTHIKICIWSFTWKYKKIKRIESYLSNYMFNYWYRLIRLNWSFTVLY